MTNKTKRRVRARQRRAAERFAFMRVTLVRYAITPTADPSVWNVTCEFSTPDGRGAGAIERRAT